MTGQSAQVHVSPSGRLSIPAGMRRQLGLEKGGVVSLMLDDDGLRIETAQQFVKRIQKLAREDGWHRVGSVDGFIASRREEARKEAEDLSGNAG